MSAMDDIHIGEPRREPAHAQFQGMRDLLLALCIVILAALSMQTNDPTGAAGLSSETAVQDWKGNSGTLPTQR